MKLAVFAYSAIGYECLKVLIEANDDIVAVVTHDDDPQEEIWFPSVAELGRAHGLSVYSPDNPNTAAFIGLMRALSPDLIFSFYYRRLLCDDLLAVSRLGGINLHGSLLPRYRGRCPINWVLIHGEAETGVTLHYMVAKADAGDIISQKRVPIDFKDTALTLSGKLTKAGAELLKESYPLIKRGEAQRIPQDASLATRFGGRRPEDGKIDWHNSALSIYNLVRAVTHPYPGAFTFWGEKKLYVWAATPETEGPQTNRTSPGTVQAKDERGVLVATGNGSLRITLAQCLGGGEMAANELLDRYGISIGARFGESRQDLSLQTAEK